MHRSLLLLLTALATLPPVSRAADHSVNNTATPARFRVTSEVINPGVGPFTATTAGKLGHSFLRNGGSGFEPVQFRDRYFATADDADSITVNRVSLSHYDTYAEGLLDGAKVMVFRVSGGRMTLVREDSVAPGGHKASGWNSVTNDRLIDPATTVFTGGLEPWGRRACPYWFAIVSVDRQGRESAPSTAIRIDRPVGVKGRRTASADQASVVVPRASRPASDGAASIPTPAAFQARYDETADQVVMSWSPAPHPDLLGYRVIRSDYDPAKHAGFRLDLAGRATSPEQQIKRGDMVIVQKTLFETSRSVHLTKRVFDAAGHDAFLPNEIGIHPDEDPEISWKLVPHPADTPVQDGGETFARVEIKTAREFAIKRYAYGPVTQHWWPVFEPGVEYVFEVWARTESGSASASFEFNGFYSPAGANPVPAAAFTLDATWRKLTHSFRIPAPYSVGEAINQYVFSVRGPAVVQLDNLRIHRSDTTLGGLTPEDERMFREARIGALRTHNFIKTFRSTYSMAQLTGAAGTTNGVFGDTLGQTLGVIEKIGTRPWLQIEMHMSPDEWLGFVEFMAAPYDPAKDVASAKPWAAKRLAQGRAAPWTDAFDKIYFEVSNETWNTLFAPWTFQDMPDAATGRSLDRGTVYGLFQEWVIDQFARSPYWTPEIAKKFEFVIGGWAIQTNESGYGQRAIAASPRSRHLTIADYNGGWDEGEGPMTETDASLQRILLQATQVGEPRSRAYADFLAKEKGAGRGGWVNGVYEAGPGYALSGLNGQARMSQEEVETQARAMKSLASGTATLDSFLEKATHGFVLNNFFTLSRGRTHWVSHTDLKNGGHAHLPFVTIRLFNQEGVGDLLKVDPLSGPTINAPAFKRRPASPDLALVTAYATRAGDRVNVFVLSRRLDKYPDPSDDGFTPVTLELPFASAQKVTLHRLAGDPRAHNLDAETVKIERVVFPRPLARRDGAATLEFPLVKTTGADDRGIPPGATFLYVFDGVR